jgi:hypothetical protein
MSDGRIRELQRRIADLKSRWPAHSVPPAMMQQLDELEEELELEAKKTDEDARNAQEDVPGRL